MTTNSIIDLSISRYFYINEITDMYQYTNKRELLNYLVNQSKLYGRFVDPSDYDEYLYKDAFAESMTSGYDITTIANWTDLVHYMKLYLLRVISSTPYYNGPYSVETTYILPELLNINAFKVLSLDSQPGFFVVNNEIGRSFLQLPYIQLLASGTVIEKIINIAIGFNAKFLALVSINGVTQTIKTYDTYQKFPLIKLNEPLVSIFFGVNRPDPQSKDPDEFYNFLNYILTNAFFHDIINIVNIAVKD